MLVTLWYSANQCCIRDVSDRFNVTKSSVKRITKRVLIAIKSLANEVIVWPSGDYKDRVVKGFHDIKGIWGVIGLIDGCHLEIPQQSIDTAAFINRKGYSSVILQGICDNELRFTIVNIWFPGSVHDARVLRRSQIFIAAEDAQEHDNIFPDDTFLLGDPAYPCLPWLMVPFKDVGRLNRNKRTYNYKVSATRVHIERTFGQLKGRFPKLNFIDMVDFEEINTLVIACCVMHNFCIKFNDEIDMANEDDGYDYNNFEGIYANTPDGNSERNRLVDLLAHDDN